MTDAAVPAVREPAPAVFVQPPEYDNGMQTGSAVAGLLRADRGVMPDKVAEQLSAYGGAGADIGVQEEQIEALYDWACLGADCPDDARRVAYGAASMFSRYSFGTMGKFAAADRPKRADGIRAELRRQMGDPGSLVSETDRPEPRGVYVAAPAQPTVTATVEDIAALMGQIAKVRDGLASGGLNTDQASKELAAAHAAAETMITQPPSAHPVA